MADTERESGSNQGMSQGERLLRSPEAAHAADKVQADVALQLQAALHGPVGSALAATAPQGELGSGGAGDGVHAHAPLHAPPHAQMHQEAQALLGAAIPRQFIATGAAMTAAYVAIAEGDERRTAGALLCAQRLLFPNDPLGLVATSSAARRALEPLAAPDDGPGDAGSADAAAQMQRRVAADIEQLERAYLGSAGHLELAALGSYSWKQATGGAGPESGALGGPLGPFLNGMLRWAFYAEAALDGIRRDDWARAGAALIAARQVTSSQ